MRLAVEIPLPIEVQIRARAAASGQDLAEFVLQAVAEKLADGESADARQLQHGADWAEKLQGCIALHPVSKPLADAEWLDVESLEWARTEGDARISLQEVRRRLAPLLGALADAVIVERSEY